MRILLFLLIALIPTIAFGQAKYDSLLKAFSDEVIFHKRSDLNKEGGIPSHLDHELGKIPDVEIRQMAICAMVDNLFGFVWMDSLYLKTKLKTVLENPASEEIKQLATRVSREINNTLINKRIRDISLPDSNDKLVSLYSLLKDYDYVVIDLWATWCAPCIGEMKNFNGYKNKYNIQFYSISFDDERSKVLKFTKKHDDYTWPIVFAGKTSELWEYFRIRFVPAYYILNKEGVVISRVFRYQLEGVFRELFD